MTAPRRNHAAAIALRVGVERVFARGGTITQVMQLFMITYDQAHDIHNGMRVTRSNRRCHTVEERSA